jgi:alpha-L-rhamnosidase
VTIPANTTATVFLPAIASGHVMQDGQAAKPKKDGESYVVEVGSGAHKFEVK